ncbi:MAG: cupin domain-containing protein [Polyangiales bacterium]
MIAIAAADVAPRARATYYPEPFASRVAGREKRVLGDLFTLSQFGVNLTRLAPHAASALRHAHSHQDELIYVLRGHPALYTDEGRTLLAPGMCAGFRAGSGNAHQLVNESEELVEYLEIGDRSAGDRCVYPDDDLAAQLVDGRWRFTHKDGTPY